MRSEARSRDELTNITHICRRPNHRIRRTPEENRAPKPFVGIGEEDINYALTSVPFTRTPVVEIRGAVDWSSGSGRPRPLANAAASGDGPRRPIRLSAVLKHDRHLQTHPASCRTP